MGVNFFVSGSLLRETTQQSPLLQVTTPTLRLSSDPLWLCGTVFEPSTMSWNVLNVRNFLTFTHNSVTSHDASEYRCHTYSKNCHLVLHKCLHVLLYDQFLKLPVDFWYLPQNIFYLCPPDILIATFSDCAFALTGGTHLDLLGIETHVHRQGWWGIHMVYTHCICICLCICVQIHVYDVYIVCMYIFCTGAGPHHYM